MPRRKGKGRAVKSARRKFGAHYESDDLKMAPHTMAIHRGVVSKDIKDLIGDVRKVMEPFTAASLKVSKSNTLKDFVAIAGPMHVTHLLVFTQTEVGDYMKIVRVPRGPTLHFKLLEYSCANDVLNTMRKRHTHQKQFLHQPLLVINGFSATKTPDDADNKAPQMEAHHKLLTTTLQNMFPSINVTKVNLESIRRCVMFNFNKEDKTIDFRQYNIRLMPVGLSKPVKKLVQEQLPDLSRFQDISEFIENGGNLSESEAEFDGPDNQIKMPQDVKTGGAVNLKSSTSAIRLSEIGPRLKLKLIKIEEGVCDGEVLYHQFVQKTPEELKIIREKAKTKKKSQKVKIKKRDREDNDSKKGDDKKASRRRYDRNSNNDGNQEAPYDQDEENIEYYRQELGEEPDAEFGKKYKKRKREPDDDFLSKKRKTSNQNDELNENDDEADAHDSHLNLKFKDKNLSVQKAKFLRFSKKKSSSFKSK